MYSVFSPRRVLCKQRVLPAWRYRRLYAGSSDSVQAENIVPRPFCPYVSCSMPTIYFLDLLKMRLSSLVGLASGTSKKYRSLLLAVSSSTINKLSEYIIFKLPLFAIIASLLGCFPNHSTAKEIRIKCRTARWLVKTAVLRIRSLLVICH
jgi:hypothetical protein